MPRLRVLALLPLLLLTTVRPVAAASGPETIALPEGFQPEGIAIGNGQTFYVGSIPTGAVYRGNLRTGGGNVLVPAHEDRAAIGVAVEGQRLWVAGGPTGMAFVYDARTGDDIEQITLTTTDAFINDVVVTRDAAYFTDSFSATLFRVDTSTFAVTALPLTGDFALQPGFNTNGIDATPDGRALVIVQSNTGRLFRVDPRTGESAIIDLGGETVASGDGILLHGRTLYVVQNFLNQVSVVELAPDLLSGAVTDVLTDPDFDIPTTIDRHGSRLYAVNARFTTEPTPETEYDVVRVG